MKQIPNLDPTLDAFLQGKAVRIQEYLGSHAAVVDGEPGYRFRVWAPHAKLAAVMGDFNGWDGGSHPMEPVGAGVWELFLPGLQRYDTYKYAIHTQDGRVLAKADPYAFHAETRPGTASKLYELGDYQWGDQQWMEFRKTHLPYDRPLNIYEVHLGSWRRTGEGEFLSYRDMARYLVPYVKEMGFTHVELLPVSEHPLDASWGYQCTGYFAATSRFGTPDDFMYLVDQLHQGGIGVLLDWVPAHFPKDAFGLYEFDGAPCYEYADPRKREHADWGTRVFDYGRNEVRSFLYSSALFWLEQYHIDGLRVDAVASMLYLDYGREGGRWCPNVFGGHENLEAVEFLQQLNTQIFLAHPDVLMIAEESTAWPRVSHPVGPGGLEGGLGFNMKWNMGWMNDITHYMKLDPYFRQFNHKDITFSLMYAFSENFVLPLSHDEVVHMKGSLINKMPGTDDEKFPAVRAFYTYMLTHPGKKLLFMGAEFGQFHEWNFEYSLDWHLLEQERHERLHNFFRSANQFYLANPELWELDFSWEGFQWICADDNQGNCAAFLRKDKKGKFLLSISNFSPVHRAGYRLGVPVHGRYDVVFNTDDPAFGGSGLGDQAPVKSQYIPCHGMDQSIAIDLPPMSTVLLRCTRKFPARRSKAELIPKAKPVPTGTKKPAAKKAPARQKTPARAVRKRGSQNP
ncbi:1,4-alpha-glucan branching protein GlgB [Pseudoflavonifractor sp. 524-17]|uniref:1,4-alpha-glucan branching protein GlgB n=1 Tax=Pseudoflavonifractor sp. 524-17 TaxID=2304577 RepID=UPI00137ABDFF|nr:1,4-alpha-glucan branching protein GlgB [Pseudoflavonifractor sp. 524-17]NCE65161.1 1,4-alpha-glucan branching protein GlgB [Pseudoflavonifractor sp. 524-17]